MSARNQPRAHDAGAPVKPADRKPIAIAFLVSSGMLAAWVIALFVVPAPPLMISAVCAALCLLAMLFAPTTGARAIWFNVAFLILAVGAFDAWVARKGVVEGKQQTFGDSGGLFQVDDVLGVRPKPGLRTTAKMTLDGATIYDVVYTFDDDGLRVSPPVVSGASEDCALFFGCSYTFGEGVNDEETMPFRAGVRSRMRVRNFAYSGYGPHQMLAAIEAGLVERAAHCRPRYAVYQAVYHHALRAAGVWTWDRHGPRYVLENGRAVRRGNFDSQADADAPLRALEQSGVAKQLRLARMDLGATDVTAEDITLTRAIVAESARKLRERWPDIELHVIDWDGIDPIAPPPLFDRADPVLAGITFHSIGQMLPAVDDPQTEYKLPRDVHPNPRAHDLIAQYVAEKILAAKPSPGSN